MTALRDRLPWVVGIGALILGVVAALLAAVLTPERTGDDEASSPSPTDTSTPEFDAGPVSQGVEVYSNVIQSGGEIEGGRDAGGVAPAPNCAETTTAYDWYLSDPYPQGSLVAQSGSSTIASPNSAYEGGSGYVFNAHMLPGESVSFRYQFDACRPFTVETFLDEGESGLTVTGPDGVAFATRSQTPPVGVEITESGGRTTATYTPEVSGEWTVSVDYVGAGESRFIVIVDQPGPSESTPIAVCEVTVDADTAILDASQSYDPDGDPVTAYWWDFAQQNQLEDGSTVDLSTLQHGWHLVYCVVGEGPFESAWVGVEVWVGPDRPVIAPPAIPVTFEAVGLGREPEIACTVTVGPDGLDFDMPDHTSAGEKFTEWSWDLPFGQTSADLSGHLDLPIGVGILHDAACFGTSADGTISYSSIHITLEYSPATLWA